jgi:predicted DCC family thiol-disulfide oxidoreductase YuxK
MPDQHDSAAGTVPAAYSYRDDPAVPEFPDDRPIIVFDGYCVLCSGWASFILRHDRHATYRLLPAQSPIGQDGRFHFHVEIGHPLIGLIVRYGGWVVPRP